MGYNISETTGAVGGGTAGLDTWTFTVDFSTGGATTVSGDFDEVPIGGGPPSEADGGYSFGALNTNAFGSLNTDTTTGEFTFTIDKQAFFASGSDQTIEFTVTGTDSDGSDTDTVFINLLLCVARGTRIATPAGAVPVETLEPGDPVTTLNGQVRQIRWIGRRRLGPAELAAHPNLRPVRIGRGAFGPDLPERDLRVSPQHRVLVGGWRAELLFGEAEVLVPAQALAGDGAIRIDHACREAEYFHLLFDAHEIILTEGLPTESFHPGRHALAAMDPGARDELIHLFPEFGTAAGLPETARPALRPWEGRLVASGAERRSNSAGARA